MTSSNRRGELPGRPSFSDPATWHAHPRRSRATTASTWARRSTRGPRTPRQPARAIVAGRRRSWSARPFPRSSVELQKSSGIEASNRCEDDFLCASETTPTPARTAPTAKLPVAEKHMGLLARRSGSQSTAVRSTTARPSVPFEVSSRRNTSPATYTPVVSQVTQLGSPGAWRHDDPARSSKPPGEEAWPA